MKAGSFDRYGLIEMALKENGLAVVESVKEGKKTVITVACEQSYKGIEFPIKKLGFSPATSLAEKGD